MQLPLVSCFRCERFKVRFSRADNMAIIRSWLAQYDIILAGRYSEWEYYNSDHAFLAGKKAAEKVMSGMQTVKQSIQGE